MLQLGVGCLALGREWGVTNREPPSDEAANTFLVEAYNLGMRYFNTAPAYAYSEERIGKWYKSLTPEQQNTITIATKFGEFWNFETCSPYRIYTYENLKKSIDRSLELLGKIDIIQVHGFTKEVWDKNSEDILKAFEYAKSVGVKKMGASLSNPNAASIVIEHDVFEVMQIPHNIKYPYDKSIIQDALANKKLLVINRPFAMGEIAQTDLRQAKVDAYKFILKDVTEGIILTGTKSVDHLKENIEIFNQALQELKT